MAPMTGSKVTVAALALVLALGLSFGAPNRAVAQTSAQKTSAQKTSAQEAAQFVQTLGNQAVRILAANARTNSQQRRDALRKLIRAEFNLGLTGQFVLGQNWGRSSPEQRAEYQILFKQYLLNNYVRHLGAHGAKSLTVVDSRRVGEKDVLVESRIETLSGTADTVWRVRADNDRYKVIDISIDGVSLALTQRREFASIISQRGVEGLLKMLRDKLSVQAGSARRPYRLEGSHAALLNSILASPNANRVLLIKK